MISARELFVQGMSFGDMVGMFIESIKRVVKFATVSAMGLFLVKRPIIGQ